MLVLAARRAPPPERALTMFAAAALAGHLVQIQFLFETVAGTLVSTLLLAFAARLEPGTLPPAQWRHFPVVLAPVFGPRARAVFRRPGARAAVGAAAVVLAVAGLLINGAILTAADRRYTAPGSLPTAVVADGIEAFPPLAVVYRKYLFGALTRNWYSLREQDPEQADRLLRLADREAAAAVEREPWNWRIAHLLARLYRVAADTRPGYEARAHSHLERARTLAPAREVFPGPLAPPGDLASSPMPGGRPRTPLASIAWGRLPRDCAGGGVRRLAHHPLRLRPGAGRARRPRRRLPLPHQGVPVSAGLQYVEGMAVIAQRRRASRVHLRWHAGAWARCRFSTRGIARHSLRPYRYAGERGSERQR